MRQQRTRQPEHRRNKGPVCFVCEEPAVPASLKMIQKKLHFVCEDCK